MPVFDFFKQTSKSGVQGKHYEEVAVDKIIPNPNQPRVIFDDNALVELAQSIAQVGLIQPLLVRKLSDGNFELVAGERRLRAVKSLGHETVSCMVQNELATEESAVMALIENLQRENLHYLEEAQCYASLLQNYSLTQEQLAERLGKSQSGIANKLRLLRLTPAVAQALYASGLSERHAREIFRLKDETVQLEAIDSIRDKSMSVKETERLVTKTLDSTGTQGVRPKPKIMRVMRDYRLFINTINEAVGILREAGLDVDVVQAERDDGVDIEIHVTNTMLKRGKTSE